MSLQKSSTRVSEIAKQDEKGAEISVYRGELSAKVVSHSVAKTKAAFPSLPPEFYKILIDRVKEKGFSDERLTDSINNVIDTCQYPTPTLANFLSFDRSVKLLSYQEMCHLVTEGKASFETYAKVKVKGKTHYVSQSMKDRYNLPDEI